MKIMKNYIDRFAIFAYALGILSCLYALVSCAAFNSATDAVNAPSGTGGTFLTDGVSGLLRIATNPADVFGWKSVCALVAVGASAFFGHRALKARRAK